ncbi:MAG: carbamate kinase [Phycisphaerales bacterium]|nr:MAG: carbamate kinase [Phycisphaerales bacterium]
MKDRSKPIVVALGGNALSPPDEEGNIAQQFRQTRETARGLADLLMGDAPVVVTHGNGPQVGNAVRRVELSSHEVYPLDLGICVADLQGGMGYMISQVFTNELRHRGSNKVVSTLVTTVLVDADDPALSSPSKPIGLFYDRKRADACIQEYGWDMIEVPGKGYRRVVPSPQPRAIVEIDLVRALVAAGELFVALGGGGVPVYYDENGDLQGLEAVVDKDLASGLLARQIGAGTFIILTDVEKVFADFGKPSQRPLDRLDATEAQRLLDEGQFPPGSMGPKIEAAVDFLHHTEDDSARVIICSIESITDALAGHAGTCITRS